MFESDPKALAIYLKKDWVKIGGVNRKSNTFEWVIPVVEELGQKVDDMVAASS